MPSSPLLDHKACLTCRMWAGSYNPFSSMDDLWGFCIARTELDLKYTQVVVGRYRKREKSGLETHATTRCEHWEPGK